jgi:hypothetical protein
MGHGVLPTHLQGHAQFPVGGADLELVYEDLPLHLHISAAPEQGSYASQERVRSCKSADCTDRTACCAERE